MEMKELLKRWAELEPGWCELRVGGSYWVGKITVDGESVAYRAHPPFTEPHSLMRTQFAVQQAIVARGWDYRLETYTMEGDRQYVAWVYPGGQALGQTTEAVALLSAYLKALDEVTKKG